jgi:Right handed beta helix region
MTSTQLVDRPALAPAAEADPPVAPPRRRRRLRWVLVVAAAAGLGWASLPPGSSGTSGVPGPAGPSAVVTTIPATTGPDGDVVVHDADQLRHAVGAATPGTVITLADGEYLFATRLMATASGTAAKPITLRGSRAAMIRSTSTLGDYGLSITGAYWRVEGLTVAHAAKGIVLDGSIGTIIDGVEVFDTGEEAVRFRSCSSDSVLRNSYIHQTGINGAGYGEGVYVGSSQSSWPAYQCTDPIEGKALGDNTERVVIEGNQFVDTPAEGADIKEGTDSGTIRGNTFRATGTSGQHQADSAVDVKGNNWLVEDNTVEETDATWSDGGTTHPSHFLDGLQTHQVTAGYGTGNVFHRNTIVGPVPRFGIDLHPALGNIVYCDNSAPGAAQGLVGAVLKPARCQP